MSEQSKTPDGEEIKVPLGRFAAYKFAQIVLRDCALAGDKGLAHPYVNDRRFELAVALIQAERCLAAALKRVEELEERVKSETIALDSYAEENQRLSDRAEAAEGRAAVLSEKLSEAIGWLENLDEFIGHANIASTWLNDAHALTASPSTYLAQRDNETLERAAVIASEGSFPFDIQVWLTSRQAGNDWRGCACHCRSHPRPERLTVNLFEWLFWSVVCFGVLSWLNPHLGI